MKHPNQKKIKFEEESNDGYSTPLEIHANDSVNTTKAAAARQRIKRSPRELIESINLESFKELPANYLNLYVKNSSNIDPVYGVRFKNKNIMLGDKILHFHGDNLRVKEKTFKGAPGLYELLFIRRPKENSYTQDYLHIK